MTERFVDSPGGKPNVVTINFYEGNLFERSCDSSMCWLKLGEQEGWVKLLYGVGPKCRNFGATTWENVDLLCGH